MASRKISTTTIKRPPLTVQHNTSRTRRIAKRAGIDIERPGPHLPLTEQEQADAY